ncbi:MAG: PfkB family carbohydrate kinase [Candidatus Omnitrophota bacterium]|nr:PfkB family carbohydrate kinase [Candidatus Omnitrophota bacterium]
MSIIVLGTVALDTVKTPAGFRKEILGGSAAHFAMSARFFSKVNLVAVIGEDFPESHIDFLRNKGINLCSLIREKGKTFRWQGKYSGDCNLATTLNTKLGVLANFKPCITEKEKWIKNIFLANVDPDIQHKLLDNMRCPKLIGVDSMNFWIKHKRASLLKLLKRVHIYVANDAEARDLSQEDNLLKAAKALKNFGPEMIVIKKGEHGVLFYSGSFIFSLPAYPVLKIIDPTGAGDTFAGGFMGYLTKQKKINQKVLKQALVLGAVIASFNVEGFGLSCTANLTLKQINSRLKIFKRIISL